MEIENKLSPEAIDRINRTMFASTLKDIKKTLPKNCTQLCPIRLRTGELRILAKINGEDEKITPPKDFVFTEGGIKHLTNLVLDLCNPVQDAEGGN